MKIITLVRASGLRSTQTDVYSGEEFIRFENRHPIFKTLMKLEFEETIRKYSKK